MISMKINHNSDIITLIAARSMVTSYNRSDCKSIEQHIIIVLIFLLYTTAQKENMRIEDGQVSQSLARFYNRGCITGENKLVYNMVW